MHISNKALLEIGELSDRAEKLAVTGRQSDRKVADVLVQRIASIRQFGISSDEMRSAYAGALNEEINAPTVTEKQYERALYRYLTNAGVSDQEVRDITVGQQNISWTLGPQGGFTIPLDYEKQTFEAMAAVDPLTDPDICGFTMENSTTLQPQILQGYDISTVSAQLVSEITLQTAMNFPSAAGKVLRGNLIYKSSFACSYESEIDIPDFWQKISRAAGIAFARAIGAHCVTGNGTTQPQGLLTALPVPVYTTGTGKLTAADFNAIFAAIDPVYRAMPKCAWLCNDSVLTRIRNASDNSGRPLLDMSDDGLTLLDKPIYVCGSTPGNVGGSPPSSSTIIFGDLDHFRVRVSRPTLLRETQQNVKDVTAGQSLLVARIRADALLFDPSNGTKPPIVIATVTP